MGTSREILSGIRIRVQSASTGQTEGSLGIRIFAGPQWLRRDSNPQHLSV
jgi:hypothetical protein